MDYTDERNVKQFNNKCKPNAPPAGGEAKIYKSPAYGGFNVVLADKHQKGNEQCNCHHYNGRPSYRDPQCDTNACYAGCPGSLADDPWGQHQCRKYYAKKYQNHGSYCKWLEDQGCQGYCWAMDEWVCLTPNCGYNGPGQPAENDATINYMRSTGKPPNFWQGTMPQPAMGGGEWWSGCNDQNGNANCGNKAKKIMIHGHIQEIQPNKPRHGGEFLLKFVKLGWLNHADKDTKEMRSEKMLKKEMTYDA